tara:strand:- start:5 stop:196 length:192 start_codon:yes stop_codon:yes gene_type:complete
MESFYWISRYLEESRKEENYGNQLYAPSPIPPLPCEKKDSGPKELDTSNSRVIIINIAGEEDL